MMLLVILGAGASYDSAAPAIGRPPLANDLLNYPSIAAEYRASRPVIDYLRRTMLEGDLGLEEALERFSEMAASDDERRGQLVAFRFYLCRLIQNVTGGWLSTTHGFTRYLTLFNYLREWQSQSHERIRLVTFNYDMLIEDALESVISGWRFDSPGAYITREDWTLYKLHGSVSWSRVGRRRAGAGIQSNVDSAIESSMQLEQEDLPIEQYPSLSATNAEPGEAIYFPALAVPVARKTTFECPALHVEALESAIPEVRRVLICGWKAAEQHMIEMLQRVQRPVRLGVVAGNEADLDDIHNRLGDVSHYGHRALDEAAGMEALADRLDDALAGVLGPLS